MIYITSIYNTITAGQSRIDLSYMGGFTLGKISIWGLYTLRLRDLTMGGWLLRGYPFLFALSCHRKEWIGLESGAMWWELGRLLNPRRGLTIHFRHPSTFNYLPNRQPIAPTDSR
jgi:hypothetical protein